MCTNSFKELTRLFSGLSVDKRRKLIDYGKTLEKEDTTERTDTSQNPVSASSEPGKDLSDTIKNFEPSSPELSDLSETEVRSDATTALEEQEEMTDKSLKLARSKQIAKRRKEYSSQSSDEDCGIGKIQTSDRHTGASSLKRKRAMQKSQKVPKPVGSEERVNDKSSDESDNKTNVESEADGSSDICQKKQKMDQTDKE